MQNNKLIFKIEELGQQIENFRNAINISEKNIDTEFFEYLRESAVQRFEYSLESSRKILKLVLKDVHAIDTFGPKDTIKEAYQSGYINSLSEWLDMISARNIPSHTYLEQHIEDLYNKLSIFLTNIKQLHEKLSQSIR